MKAKVYVLTMTSFLFVGFLVDSGVSFWATSSLPISHRESTKAFNGCLFQRQQRWPLSSLFGSRPLPVEQVDIETGEVLHAYPSIGEAVRTLGNKISSSGISNVLSGKHKSHGGFFWRRPGDKKMPVMSISRAATPVEQVDIETGEVLHAYPSIGEAVRTLGNKISSSGISNVLSGKSKSHGGFFWRRPGDEKMSVTFSRAATPVEQVDIETGEVLHVYPSIAEAARTSGNKFYSSGISCVLSGKKKSHGGFFWRRPGDKKMPVMPISHAATPVEQVDIETGEVLHVYPSIAEAARTSGNKIYSSGISCVLSGKIKAHGGFFWQRPGDKKMPAATRQPVEQICAQTGKVLATFDSISEAGQSLKIPTHSIRMILEGIQKQTRGYAFRKVGKPLPLQPGRGKYSGRPVHQICLETGDILATHPSMSEAGKAVNMTRAAIHRVATGQKSAKSAGGYAWRCVRSVQQICLETGDVLATYPSQYAASKAVNLQIEHIFNAATSKNRESAGGYAWRYV